MTLTRADLDAMAIANANAQRIELASLDELTGLYSRGIFAQELCRAVTACKCDRCIHCEWYSERIAGVLREVGLAVDPLAAKG